ncbi:protein phosphatase 2C domain-containing protein [Streptomyces sp. NPDC048606]|uniref:PP2C family serine/threonine-protein phosphatase n=1 Tax=Streptomyces sp. NPDC048606 TaxID=3154726 RepID=UPI003439CFED
MSMHRPSGCPSCAEPLEEGDRFCGVCGYDLSAAHPSPDGTAPTLPVTPRPAAPAPPPPVPPAPPTAPPAAVPPPAASPVAAPPPAAPPIGMPPAPPVVPPMPASPPPVPVPPPGAYGEHHPGAPGEPIPAGVPAPGWAEAGEEGAAAPGGYAAPYGQAAPVRHDPPGGGAGTPPEAPPTGGAPEGGPESFPWGTDEPGAPYGEAPTAPAHEDPYAAHRAEGGPTCVACRAGHVDPDGYCEHCGHAQPRERDHLEEELGSVAAVSDRGLRHHRNEDSFAVSATALPDGSAATVAIVCDGVSSASRPDEASAAAARAANEALLEALPRGAHAQEAMHEAILAAAAAVNALAPPTPGAQNAPACTLVGAVVGGGLLTIGWVGDSRAYWVPDDRAAVPRRLTEDDSWAAQMVAAGLMGEAEAYADARAHAITGWLGADAYDLEPHTASFRPDHPGVVVVCTDGLWNYAESARDMARVLPPDAAERPLHSAQVLVGHALDGGGHDNITVAVVPFTEPAGAGTETEPGEPARAEPEAEPHPGV